MRGDLTAHKHSNMMERQPCTCWGPLVDSVKHNRCTLHASSNACIHTIPPPSPYLYSGRFLHPERCMHHTLIVSHYSHTFPLPLFRTVPPS